MPMPRASHLGPFDTIEEPSAEDCPDRGKVAHSNATHLRMCGLQYHVMFCQVGKTGKRESIRRPSNLLERYQSSNG